MARCVAEIDEDDVNDVQERTYLYCGTGIWKQIVNKLGELYEQAIER